MARDLIFGRTTRDWGIGSIVLPASQERRLLDKVDDVRHDVRRAGRAAQLGLLCLSAAVGLAAVAGVYQATTREGGRS